MVRKFGFGTIIIGLAALAVSTIGQRGLFAAGVEPLELSELAGRAEVVALAKVVRVEEDKSDARRSTLRDEVTIKVASVIKGTLTQSELKITLQSRGEKGLDPTLKVGDIGVFFLRDVTGARAKLAYRGSAAVFQKGNFVFSDRSEKRKDAKMKTKRVKLETSKGDIIIELNEEAAPVTVRNFLSYVEAGFYDGTIFHRVIRNFMIQGGGFTADMSQKKTHPPIVNEASNGLKNLRGTIAMARTSDPNSATSQFFINHKDNNRLNYVENRSPGYTVFGKVAEGMDVVDAIAAVKTTKKGRYADVPVEPVAIISAKTVPVE